MMFDQPLRTEGPVAAVEQSYENKQFTQLAIAGMRLYRSMCVECHGADAKGTGDGPNLLRAQYHAKRFGKTAFHAAVKGGVPQQKWAMGDMPGFPDLDFNQIEQVERYVRELQRPVDFH